MKISLKNEAILLIPFSISFVFSFPMRCINISFIFSELLKKLLNLFAVSMSPLIMILLENLSEPFYKINKAKVAGVVINSTSNSPSSSNMIIVLSDICNIVE